MHREDLQAALRRLVNHSRSMLEAAEAGDWACLDELGARRNAELQSCFSAPVGAAEAHLAREALTALIDINDRLARRVKEERDTVLEHSSTLRRGRTASSIYVDNLPRDQ